MIIIFSYYYHYTEPPNAKLRSLPTYITLTVGKHKREARYHRKGNFMKKSLWPRVGMENNQPSSESTDDPQKGGEAGLYKYGMETNFKAMLNAVKCTLI